jgi:tetratricopeptide (TPR) repeat protein
MSQQKYSKAYEAYQQAVYRDGRNPTFWCSIGVLYYQINQYRDALDAYSRAIRLNPYISEVWYDLGTLVCQIFSFTLLISTILNCELVTNFFFSLLLYFYSTSLATIRPTTLSMHTSAPQTLIPPMCTSKPVCSS